MDPKYSVIMRLTCRSWSFFHVNIVLRTVIQVNLSVKLSLGSMETEGRLDWNMGPRPLGLKEIDGLLVPPGKAYTMRLDCSDLKSRFKDNDLSQYYLLVGGKPFLNMIFEPHREKTGFLHMQKQRCRSAVQ